LGAIVVGLSADGYHRGNGYEEFFLSVAVILLVLSAVLAVAVCVGITARAVFVGQAVSPHVYKLDALSGLGC